MGRLGPKVAKATKELDLSSLILYFCPFFFQIPHINNSRFIKIGQLLNNAHDWGITSTHQTEDLIDARR
jgi:hypothetical protein